MTDKIKDLARDFIAGTLSRRDFGKRAGMVGASAAAVSLALGGAATDAMAADFNWQAHKGKKLRLLHNKHPYADAMIAD